MYAQDILFSLLKRGNKKEDFFVKKEIKKTKGHFKP